MCTCIKFTSYIYVCVCVWFIGNEIVLLPACVSQFLVRMVWKAVKERLGFGIKAENVPPRPGNAPRSPEELEDTEGAQRRVHVLVLFIDLTHTPVTAIAAVA